MRRLKLLTGRTGPDIEDIPNDVIEIQSDEQADRMIEAQQAVETSDPVTRPRKGRELKPTFRVTPEVETAMLDTSGEGRKPPVKQKTGNAKKKNNNPRRGRRRKG